MSRAARRCCRRTGAPSPTSPATPNIGTTELSADLGAGSFLGLPVMIWMLVVVALGAAYIVAPHAAGPAHLRRRRQRTRRGAVGRQGQPGQDVRLHVLRLLRGASSGSSSPASCRPSHPATGETFELNAIAAAVLGGTSMSGGRGRIGGTIVGAFVIGILSDGLVMMGVSSLLADGDQGPRHHRRRGHRPGAKPAAGTRGAAAGGSGDRLARTLFGN